MKSLLNKLRSLTRPVKKQLYITPLFHCDIEFLTYAHSLIKRANYAGGVIEIHLKTAFEETLTKLPPDAFVHCPCPKIEYHFTALELEAFRKVLFNYQAYMGEIVSTGFEPVIGNSVQNAERARKLASRLHPSFLELYNPS